MRLAGRLQAAIEILDDVLSRHTPVNMALRDWGKSHRFAGSKDRTVIGHYVHDALRRRSSIGWKMDNDSPRSLILGHIIFHGEVNPAELKRIFLDDKFAPSALSQDEALRLGGAISLDDAPDWVRADVPEWIWPAFSNNFGEDAVAEGIALTERPSLDVRVNELKMSRETALRALSKYNPQPTHLSPIGLRFDAPEGNERLPNIQIDPAYQTGGIEIQDEGSQIVSLLINAQPQDRVLDFCAGGGGKSLALASEMENTGQIYGFDIDKRRLAPLYARALRAGADNIEVCQPPLSNLTSLAGNLDRVLIDAPCTGVGTWRRKPDAKWRLKETALETRLKEQQTVLTQAKGFVRPGGLLFYVTCSMLAEENEGQVYSFLEAHPDFTLLSAGEVWEEKFGHHPNKPWSSDGCSLTLTPASTQTDGFFFAVMEKQAH